MEVTPELKKLLKKLRLSGVLATLPDRAGLATHGKLSYPEFLELILSDEVERRDHGALKRRLIAAGFEDEWTPERLDWNAPVQFDRSRLKDLFSLGFLDRKENVTFTGPVGVGKTCWACALGHAACRAGYNALFLRASVLLKDLLRAEADHSHERQMRRFLAPDLLVIDDFALRRMDPRESADIYELLIERHTRASTIITSNRSIDEWVAAFDDPILANSALDRLAHRAHQIVIDGESLRRRDASSGGHPAPQTSTTREGAAARATVPAVESPEGAASGPDAARLAERSRRARRTAPAQATSAASTTVAKRTAKV